MLQKNQYFERPVWKFREPEMYEVPQINDADNF